MKHEDIKNILKDVTGLTDDGIKAIIDMNTAEIEKTKTDITQTVTSLQEQLKTRDADIAEFKKNLGDNSDLKTKFEELQNKYTSDTQQLQAEIESRNYKDALRNAIAENGIKFSSKAAENYFTSEAINKSLKLENGKLAGFSDFYKSQFEEDKSAFVTTDETPKPQFSTGKGFNTDNRIVTAAQAAAASFNSRFAANTTAKN